MRVVVPHGSTREATIPVIDKALDHLFGEAGSARIEIVDQKKVWQDSVMVFSFTGKLGFISVPLAGSIDVDDVNVTVDAELPAMLKTFVGEEKVRTIVDENVRRMVSAQH